MNVPKMRFRDDDGQEYPDWCGGKLGEIGSVLMCKRILKEQTQPVGDVPFYKIGTFGKQPDAYISNEVYESFKQKYSFPKKGDILISAAGTIGRTVVYDGLPAYFQDSNIVWIDNNEQKVRNAFLYYLYAKTTWNTENTTIARLYNDNLKSIFINFPSLPEQTKIANFLTAVDEKITQLTQKSDLLTQYKKGVMQKIFSQELRFKDDDGSEFPEWTFVALADISTKKSSNISANSLDENEGEFKIYGAAGVLKKINFYTQEEPYISVVKDGAGVGRTFYCEAKTSVLGTLEIIQPSHGVDSRFLHNVMQQIDFTAYITGSTIPHVYYKDYSKETVSLPCNKEQTKIANFLTAIDDKISQTQAELDAVKQYKQGLLQQMFV